MFKIKVVRDFIAEAFLVTLTTTLFVHISEETFLRGYVEISTLVYSIFAFCLIITALLSGVCLYKVSDQSPRKSWVGNRVLLIIFIIFGLAYTSGVAAAGIWEEDILEYASIAVFYWVGIRLLHIPDFEESVQNISYEKQIS